MRFCTVTGTVTEEPRGRAGQAQQSWQGDTMSNAEDPTVLRAKINAETAQIAWTGVQRFFAQGKAIYVHPSADLVEVALVIGLDDRSALEQFMADGLVQTVTDQQAREWVEADAMMWSVVVRPFVLVQPLLAQSSTN